MLTDYIQIARDFQALPQAEEFHSHVINALNKFTNCLKNSTYLSCVYFGKPSSSYRAAGLVSRKLVILFVTWQSYIIICLILKAHYPSETRYDSYKDVVKMLKKIFLIKQFSLLVNHHPAKFLKWTVPSSTYGSVHYWFWEYQDENKLWSRPTHSIEPVQTAPHILFLELSNII